MNDLFSKQYVSTSYFTSGALVVSPSVTGLVPAAGEMCLLEAHFRGEVAPGVGQCITVVNATQTKDILKSRMMFNTGSANQYVSDYIQMWLFNTDSISLVMLLNFVTATGRIEGRLTRFKI